ncbi:hypothetical protein ACD661_03775 [Legionella lytica]|uniref:Protein kinase domain-containing protein n=1 Tax=Legionella lytica TaxID=96232 RepID=A0ABW8D6S4_9GAMM
MTPLFPEKGQYILIQQGVVGDCYLLCSLDCILNGRPENQDLIRSKFTQTHEGVYLRIKRTDQSHYLNPEKMQGKYIYSYDVETDEDVIFIDNQKLEAIDGDSGGVQSNALAVKILERISSYYYVGAWDNEGVDASIFAHNIPQRHQETSTIFVGKLLGIETTDTRDINAIINLKMLNPNEPIYISIDYGDRDAFGHTVGRHALRIESIIPMQNGDYEIVLINPEDNTKQEVFTLSDIKTRNYRFSIFDMGFHKKNLIEPRHGAQPKPLYAAGYPEFPPIVALAPAALPIRYGQHGYPPVQNPAIVAPLRPRPIHPGRNNVLLKPLNQPPNPILPLNQHAAHYGQHIYPGYQRPVAPPPGPNIAYAQQRYNLIPAPAIIAPQPSPLITPIPDNYEQHTEPYIAKAQLFFRKAFNGMEYHQISCSSKAEANAIQLQLKALGVNPSQVFNANDSWRINCDKLTVQIDARQCIEEAIKSYQNMPQNCIIRGKEPRVFSRGYPEISHYELCCSSQKEAVAILKQLNSFGVHSMQIFEDKGRWIIHCNKKTLIQDAKQNIETVLKHLEASSAPQVFAPQAQQPGAPQAPPVKAGIHAWINSPSPISFREWIKGLDDRKAAILSNSLHSLETQFNLSLMLQWMKPLTPIEESELLFILNNYKVEYRGGTNSKNLLIINAITGEKEILKLEHRMGNPDTQAQYLQEIPELQEYFVQVHFNKAVAITKDNYGLNDRCLQITDFCPGNDISTQANMRLSDEERLIAAGNIYSQMAQALILMEQNATFYMDMKNSNWLLEVNGILKIADTKSMCPAENFTSLSSLSSNGYNWLRTKYITPPELLSWDSDPDTLISISHAEAFMFGKNLYEFLAATPPSRTVNAIQSFMEHHANAEAYDFSAPIFQTHVGARYTRLIQQCIKENPLERFDMNQVQHAMQSIQDIEKDHHALGTYWEKMNQLDQMKNQYPDLAPDIEVHMISWQNQMLNPLLGNIELAVINDMMETYGLIIHTIQQAREQYQNDPNLHQELDKIQEGLNRYDVGLLHFTTTLRTLNQLIEETEQAYIQQQTFETLTHKLKENYGHLAQIQDNLAQIENRIGFYAYMPIEDINNFLRAIVSTMEQSNAYANMAANQQQPHHDRVETSKRSQANMAAGNPYSFLAGTQMNVDQPPTDANENPPDMEKRNKYPK